MLTGKLDTLSVTEVLTLLSRSRSSGALRIKGPEEGVVFCVEGAVTIAASYPGDRLVDVLVRPGILGATDWQAATANADQGVTLTSTVVGKGVDPARLQAFIRLQTEESIFELSQWTEGEFGFQGGQTHPLSGLASFPVSELLEALVHRMERWPDLVAQLPGVDAPLLPVAMLPSDNHELTLSAAQLQLLMGVDGAKSVRQLARTRGDGLFHTTELAVALLDAGYIRFDGMDARPSAVSRAGTPRPAARKPPAPEAAPAPAPAPAPKREAPAKAVASEPVGVGASSGRATKSSGNGKPRVPAKVAATVDAEGGTDKPDRSLVLRLLAAVKELEVPEGGAK